MKKIFLFIIPIILTAEQTPIIDRVQLLENELKTLKESIGHYAEDIEENSVILEKTEKRTILDKINFSPELELRLDKMDYSSGKIEGEPTQIYTSADPSLIGSQRRDEYSKHFDPATAIRFRLNMHAELDENVKFNGRLIFVNSSQSNQRLCILSRDIKSVSSSSAFDADRAYFDYTSNKGSQNAFTFSFGLLPTTGGTPMQFAQNTQRKSMFPALVFDMNSYGVIATQQLAENSFLRVILAKAYTLKENFYPYQCNRENIDNANIAGIYFDTTFNFLGKSLLSFGVNMLNDLKAHPYLGPDVNSDDAKVLGDIFTYGIGLDIQNVAQSEATLFLHTALSNPHANGNIDDYQIDGNVTLGLTASGLTGFSEADYAQGTMLKKDGYSVYLGAKYDLSSTLNFGAEYNYGSKYWFSATQGAEDMYNKLATRGHVGEAYLSWQFHKHLYTKVGYLYMKEEYTGSGWHFGEPADKDATQTVAYLTVTAKY